MSSCLFLEWEGIVFHIIFRMVEKELQRKKNLPKKADKRCQHVNCDNYFIWLKFPRFALSSTSPNFFFVVWHEKENKLL